MVYMIEGAEQRAAKFEQTLLEKYELHFPEKSVRRRQEDKPWLTEKLKRMISERGKADRRGDMEAYNKLRNEVQRESCLTIEKYYDTNLIGLRTVSSDKWHRHVKNILNWVKVIIFAKHGLSFQRPNRARW